ncbi:auxin-induced protein 5NG4-like [Hibiscus syriacus]|uniref:Auxin-induced protein 5NG4-like n=1 Tax=Hibiscus syriacus TaxID=106335 RepID=A0A6A3A134_HIBSY|nr:auxin-induced protein 5NG4-like [Hibiscus syriacus]
MFMHIERVGLRSDGTQPFHSSLPPPVTSFSTTTTKGKVPLLYKSPEINEDTAAKAVTVQVLSWGRGASGQLGGGIEEIRIYPSAVLNLLFPDASFSLSPAPGKIFDQSGQKEQTLHSVGVSCGLFHSGLVVDGKLWMWGKGDGGRLGFGHENPAFLPTLNPHLDSVSSVALGGIHSVALTSKGEVFTCLQGLWWFGALGHRVYHRELIPRLVESNWSGTIRHIATSGTHTAAVTETGDLYAWGRDEGDGRLGLGPCRGPNEGGGLSIPSKVKELSTPIAAVSCGGFFTMALTEDGQLWNWGVFFSCLLIKL